ncbi:Hypothetical predicted protein [Olea europaea subsp. europaea]|uniref:Uncharacterized protein n=1 Tax=Olea europaea subsp. europaea TaxID=158383 RepID=A0A8S0T2C3_OLEEU|nr:Hypothetical predicted protein [Olea europaea subsp. europaea]
MAPNTITTTTPKSVIIIPRSKSQAICRRVTPTPVSPSGNVADMIEKHLPKGEMYIGTFANNTPHGSGDFKSSRMEGLGTFTGFDGDMYEGCDWWIGSRGME